MAYIETLSSFNKKVKRLKKKNSHFANDLANLIFELAKEPTKGESLGSGFYKIRLKRQNKGKRGGYRVITYFLTKDNLLYLVDIFPKSVQDSITKQEIRQILKEEGIQLD